MGMINMKVLPAPQLVGSHLQQEPVVAVKWQHGASRQSGSRLVAAGMDVSESDF